MASLVVTSRPGSGVGTICCNLDLLYLLHTQQGMPGEQRGKRGPSNPLSQRTGPKWDPAKTGQVDSSALPNLPPCPLGLLQASPLHVHLWCAPQPRNHCHLFHLSSPRFPDLSFPLLDLPTTKMKISWHLTEALTSRDVSSVDHNSRETGSAGTATKVLVLQGGKATRWPLDTAIFKLIPCPQVLMSPL